MNKHPFITVIIVMRNEEKYIRKCLESVINQDYPKDKFEIIVVDGESDDRSIEIIEEYAKDNDIKIIINKKRILAAGWNIGIKAAKGEIVIRPDAHSYIERDFINKNVETLINHPDAICVGGKIESISLDGTMAKSITNVLSSPFGVGNSYFRIGSKAKYVDTVAYGAYRKEIFDKIGYFNEELERNQDLELHSRIKKYGGKFYFNPEIKSYYFTRSTLKGFAKQAYRNGKWNIITLNWQKEALSIRHLIPFLFVISILFNSIVSFFIKKWTYILILELMLYLIGIVLATIKISKGNGLKYLFTTPFLFPILHISYGIGSLIGMFKLLFIKIQKK